MATRVIVISSDFMLKSGIASELKLNPAFDVVSTVFNVTQAANLFRSGQPNALIIDLEKQNTNDVYLKGLMEKFNLLVIIMGSHPGIAYIKSGLNNIIPKPIPGNVFSLRAFCADIQRKIALFASRAQAMSPQLSHFSQMQGAAPISQKIIAIASSTGGTDALPVILEKLPASSPPILIVQHMPAMFTKQFATRLDKFCKITVKEAANGDYLRNGVAFIAPGNLHMRLVKRGQVLAVECFTAEKVHGVRPAADVTFKSILNVIGGNAIGVILTGMGADGARGLFDLRSKGAKVIAQNETTCVVYGMPKAAVDLGATDFVLPLDRIADKIISLC